MFPNLYNLSTQQKQLIINMVVFEGEAWRWVLTWKRVLSADESRKEALLQTMLQQYYPRRAVKDNLIWGQGGRFSVRSLYSKTEKSQM